ncbi:hypothetical protein LINPERPRIM_LOCUS14593 [Linum perenne]
MELAATGSPSLRRLVLSSSSSRLIYLSIPLSEYNYTFH